MKYMLLIYTAENSYIDGERQQCYEESTALCHDLAARRQFIAASPLQPVATATSVRVRDGKPTVTDGPFAEAREVLGGYWMIQAASREEAIEWAKRCPGGENEVIEVRQVQEMSDFPEDVRRAAAGFDALGT